MADQKDRVLVALSGGVDSAVAAALLLQAGYEVHGLFLVMDPPATMGEPSAELLAARQTAQKIGIQLIELDCADAFQKEVLFPCWQAYDQGLTPNPCGLCNPRIKFHFLMQQAHAMGATRIATGHHVRLQNGNPPALLRGTDPAKDQSYFLFALDEETLRHCLFPVGHLHKTQIRQQAVDLGLENATAAESQDACIAQGAEAFPELLRQRFDALARPGPFIDMAGQEIGRHQGFHRFTRGQRKGLGLALGRPAWVRSIHSEQAAVLVTTEPSDLLTSVFEVAQVCWGPAFQDFQSDSCQVQIRYRHQAALARVSRMEPSRIRVQFDKPQRAVTPGQAAVVYQADRLVAGGWIEGPI